MFGNVAAAVDGRDPEGVHDMRVATRRLRACLKTFAPWLDPDEQRRLASAVRDLTRALGRVRELDVLRLRLAKLAERATPQRALALEHVDARLARRRRRARERMMACFADVRLDRLDARLERLHGQLEGAVAAGTVAQALNGATAQATDAYTAVPHAAGAHDAPIAELLRTIAPTLLAESRQVTEPPLTAPPGTPAAAEELHAVRIAAKKLRYQLEILEPYLGERGREAVRRLKALQETLGEFHDDTVLDDTLRAEIARASERGRALLAGELRRLRTTRRRVLARDEREVRAAIERLREQGFVALVADALAAAGVPLPTPDEAEPSVGSAATREDAAAALGGEASAQDARVGAASEVTREASS